MGWRWNSVAVPQGATILSATLNLYANTSNLGTTAKTIFYGVSQDNVTGFADLTADKPEGKTRTTASVTKDFTVANWGTTGFDKELVDVTTLVQEIVNRGGWVSGNSMALVGHDNGSTVDNYIGNGTYDSAASRGAKLSITYQTGSAPTKLQPQYLLAPFKLPAGTALQTFLTSWDSSEWTTTNAYIAQSEATDNSTSDTEIDTAAGVILTNSTVTNIDNRATSTAMCMPATGNLDTKATTNAGDIFAVRILVDIGSSESPSCGPGVTPTLQSEFFFE